MNLNVGVGDALISRMKSNTYASATSSVKSEEQQDWSAVLASVQKAKEELAEAKEAKAAESLTYVVNDTEKWAPYEELADEDGIIEYNGAIYRIDKDNHRITLGDVSDKTNCMYITLSGGGTLVVNMDNLTDLRNSIGMFSPEDRGIILRAIATMKYKESFVKDLENQRAETVNDLKKDDERLKYASENLKDVATESGGFIDVSKLEEA